MNCAEARRLLEGGVQPGSATPERARLGFHLAGCAACRAHQAALRQSLLDELLGQAAPAPTPEAPATQRPAGSPPSHPPAPGRRLRRVALGGLSIAGLAGAIVAIWVGLALFRTHQNVQAMIVSTDAATAPPPSLVAISAETSRPPAPSATPTPTAEAPTRTPAPTRAPTPTAPPATATPTAPPAGGPITVLLLGSDRRPG